jgi:hypothetical protein
MGKFLFGIFSTPVSIQQQRAHKGNAWMGNGPLSIPNFLLPSEISSLAQIGNQANAQI